MAIKFAYYIKGRFDKLSYWKIDGILRCSKLNPKNEFGGIGDSLYTLYDYTKDNNIFELAKLFDRDYFLQPLSEEKDLLNNLYSKIIIFGGKHEFFNFYHYCYIFRSSFS